MISIVWNFYAQTNCGFEVKLEESLDEQMFYEVSIFDNAPPRKIQNRIISIDKNEIIIGLRNEELGELNCEHEIIEGKLNLRFGVKGVLQEDGSIITEVSETPKYQEVAIKIEDLKTKIQQVFLNGEEIALSKSKYQIFPVEYDVIGVDTINKKNEFGEKVGIWIVEDDKYSYKQVEEPFYHNSEIIWKKIKEFYRNGQLKEVIYFNKETSPTDTIEYESFYPSGKKSEKKFTKNTFSVGERYRVIYYENGNINQDFLYNGSSIKLIGNYENGNKRYEGETKVGVEKINKGPIICYTSPIVKIKCEFWKENGDLEGNKVIEFLTNDLTNIEERKRRRTLYMRQ